jgi:hypothetical protein
MISGSTNGSFPWFSITLAAALGALGGMSPAQEEGGTIVPVAPATPSEPVAPPPVEQPSALALSTAPTNGHGIGYTRWTGLPGGRVGPARATVTATARPPVIEGIAASLDFPLNDGKAYLARVRGFIVPDRPGKLRLVVTSDDNSELWLSPDASPFNRARAAWLTGDGIFAATAPAKPGGKPGETGTYASQWSAPVEVTAGSRLYFELWHKQDAGNDHLSLLWHFEGDANVSAIPAQCLATYTPAGDDANDDGLPDAWHLEKGLSALEPAVSGSWADPDGDGVCNLDEYAAGTDPVSSAPVAGALLWERWHGISGRDVSELLRNARFTAGPDEAVFLKASATPDFPTGNHGFRISGFLVPQTSGKYQLAINGAASAELWLSTSESPVLKERVAFSSSWRARESWNVPPAQRTKVVDLVAGQAYYFEMIQKNDRGTGWAALGWKLSDEKEFVPVPASALRSPGPRPVPDRRAFLPADWIASSLLSLPENMRNRFVISEHGDPDRDGLPNWMEARVNSDPFNRTRMYETWIREWWFNVPGKSVDEARGNRTFLRGPSMVTLSHGPAAEAYTTDNYACRYRAYLTPKDSGEYRFWIAGDDQVELWLSTDGPKYSKQRIASVKPKPWEDPNSPAWTGRGQWDLRGSQQSVGIRLSAGKEYFIEVLHKDSGADDHMAIAWQFRPNNSNNWSARGLIPVSSLLSYDGDDDDGDDDYLPDSWERGHGLNEKDNGLNDFAKQGEDGDFDRDGLTNREEYLLGTHPGNPDTDGDGATDYDEVRNLGTNPLVRDSIRDFLLATIGLGGYSSASANWNSTSGGLLSESFRGTISWDFDVPSDGFWLFHLTTELMGITYGSERVPVAVAIDGKTVVRRQLAYPADKPLATLAALTPHLAAGRHTLTLNIDNMVARRTLRLVSLELFAPPNADVLLARSNRILPHPEFTRSSPACIEGHSRTPESTTVNGGPVLEGMGRAGDAGDGVLAAGSDGDHWYFNVPLENSGESQSYKVNFETGSTASGSLTWEATNAMDGETLAIRQGDSLRIGAWGSQTLAGTTPETTPSLLTSSTGESWKLAGKQTVVVDFPTAGVFMLKGDLAATAATATLTVRVIPPPEFSTTPLDALGDASRTVTWGAAPEISFDTLHEVCRTSVEHTGNSASVTLFAIQPGYGGVAGRLGAGGPILSIQPLNIIGVSDALENDLTSQSASPVPGYKLYHAPLTVSNLPEGGKVEVDIIRAGVMFPDGSFSRAVLPSDLENGWTNLAFLFPVGMPGAYCHTVSVFGRKNDYLGTR